MTSRALPKTLLDADIMDRSEFLRLVKEQLPDLRQPINKEQGLLHFEMRVLRNQAQRAIFDGDRATLAVCFGLAERAYGEGNNRLKNAVDVTFVEMLDFVTPHKKYEWAWAMFPEMLKALYGAFHFEFLGRVNPFNP